MHLDGQAVLDFWYGPKGSDEFGKNRDVWFSSGGGPEFDEACRQHCAPHYDLAVAGNYDAWGESALGSLALIILFDQIPRNIFRGQAKSFATDSRALETARRVVDNRWDHDMLDVERLFAYLPFEHSEDLEDQRQCVALYESLPDSDKRAEWVSYAVQHMEIIERFGRFPHRNEILGRPSTAEEVDFLDETGLRFGTDGKGPPEKQE